MNLLKRYWGTLRRQRLLHFLNNLFWYPQLRKNKDLYNQYGLKKSVLSAVSHRDMGSDPGESPWLDQADAKEKLLAHPDLKSFGPEIGASLLDWTDKGYLILPGFVKPDICDRISRELERAIASQKIDFDYTNSRVMNFYQHSQTVKTLISNPELLRLLDFMLGKKTIPFQSINFTRGSQQNTHSDSIHMTTQPLGYLLAIWVALEDIGPGSGPLHYYPGSQKLPYVMSEDFDNDNSFFSVGENYYEYYEEKIKSLVAEKALEKKVFLARKGDLLIWHANLLHGGELRTDPDATRKSLVAHYFCEGGVINYHEITQRPAIIRG
jgi:ectoine hydroxylase-related dioxygenase (phytanoyl-CoA dioxygenase family)